MLAYINACGVKERKVEEQCTLWELPQKPKAIAAESKGGSDIANLNYKLYQKARSQKQRGRLPLKHKQVNVDFESKSCFWGNVMP